MKPFILTIEYIALYYLELSVFIFICWGLGFWLKNRMAVNLPKTWLIENVLSIVLGLGIFICVLQWLAIAGKLNLAWILLCLIIGLAIGLSQIFELRKACSHQARVSQDKLSLHEYSAVALIFILLLPTLLAPLRPPIGWDECMYHLPHAVHWAKAGGLIVNEWLRYPWFPYNYNLLYAAGLIIQDDVLTHMLNAMAGWLSTLLVFLVARCYLNKCVAYVATGIFIYTLKNQYNDASVDLGLMLFIFSAGITFYRWLENTENRRYLLISAFFMGIAAGIKYQALIYLPLFGVGLVLCERKFGTFAMTVLCVLLPCIYWYGRNALITGDPFDPVGGGLFGFYDWNLEDYRWQFEDIKNNRGWPPRAFIAAPIPLLVKKLREQLPVRMLLVFCGYGFSVWLLTSHYPRYLLPAYPFLALLAACGWRWLVMDAIGGRIGFWRLNPQVWSKPNVQLCLWLILLLPFSLNALGKLSKNWQLIAPTQAERDIILNEHLRGYAAFNYLNRHHLDNVYQFFLEDSIYYGPHRLAGDVFGPGRYRDFFYLQPHVLSERLLSLGFNHLVINSAEHRELEVQAGFDCYFSEIFRADEVKAYRVQEENRCVGAN